MPDSCRCGCGRPARKLGLAQACYSRWVRAGRPEQVPAPRPSITAAIEWSHARRVAGIEDYLFINGDRLSARQAADRLGVSARTVQRYRGIIRQATP